MLDKMSTSYVTGIYSKGVSIVNYLWQIPMMLSTIVFARSAHAKDEKSFSIKVAQLLRVSIIIEGLCSIILIFTAKYIILFLYGEEYFDSIKVLQILLPGVLILTIFKVLNMDLAGKGKPWVSLKAMLPALIINIIMNYLFIPKYGANGAALASTISYSLAAIVFLVLYSKEVKFSIHDIFRYSKADLEVIKGIIIVLRGKKNEEI
jgi:O-antigen/teichoic acid export membrane protein